MLSIVSGKNRANNVKNGLKNPDFLENLALHRKFYSVLNLYFTGFLPFSAYRKDFAGFYAILYIVKGEYHGQGSLNKAI